MRAAVPGRSGFHPLFLYESILNILGGFIALFISRRYLYRLQPGDLAAFWMIWYGATRSFLETFRTGWNWTLGGIATAQIIGIALVLIGLIWLIYNHPRGKKPYPYLAPWTPAAEAEQLALAGATAGGGSLAMSGATDLEDDDDEWEDVDDDDLDEEDDDPDEEGGAPTATS